MHSQIMQCPLKYCHFTKVMLLFNISIMSRGVNLTAESKIKVGKFPIVSSPL